MNLEEFKTKFIKLKEKGYIPSKRNGPTGIGYTLESSLTSSENNGNESFEKHPAVVKKK